MTLKVSTATETASAVARLP